jgi:hypothetical protein
MKIRPAQNESSSLLVGYVQEVSIVGAIFEERVDDGDFAKFELAPAPDLYVVIAALVTISRISV